MKLVLKSTLYFLQMLWVSILLTGCGGGGSSSSSESSLSPNNNVVEDVFSGDYYPLEPNSQWSFEVTQSDSLVGTTQYLISLNIGSSKVVNGKTVQELLSVNPDTGELLSVEYLSKTANAVRISYEDDSLSFDELRLPIRKNERFVQIDRKNIDLGNDYDGDGINETAFYYYESTVEGLEDVQIASGLFPQSLKIKGQGTYTYRYSSNGQQFVVKQSTTSWYAEGIGQIKTIDQFIYPDKTQTSTRTLKSYKVGLRSNDAVAPQVIQTIPINNTTQGSRPVIRVQFSEDVDRRSLINANISLRAANGQQVLGVINYSTQVLTFTPQGDLNSGSYVFSIKANTLTDLIGNKSPSPFELHFNVDGDSPSVVATTPLADTKMVPLDSSVTVDFSEDIDPSSVNSDSVKLYEVNALYGDGLIPCIIKIEGKRIIASPMSPLQRNKKYKMYVYPSVKDIAGNTLTENYSFTFSSDTGLFYPLQVIKIGSSPQVVAIADVNNDGLKDVVMTTSFYFDETNDNKLMIFLQQSDGTLAVPLKYPLLSTYNCPALSVVVTNIEGDSLPEIIVGEGDCGIEVLANNNLGGWVSRGKISNSNGYKIQAADLNGDGKQDLIGIGLGTDSIYVWYQHTQEGIKTAVEYPIIHSDMKVGDINGDGLLDIIVTTGSAYVSKRMGYLLQLPAGGFGSARYIDMGLDNITRIDSISLCDISGDKRNDVLTAFSNGTVGVFRQQESGMLEAMSILPSFVSAGLLECVDIDNNGTNDILSFHSGQANVSVYKQSLNGTLENGESYETALYVDNAYKIAVDDINSDGCKDVVMSGGIGVGLTILYNRCNATSTSSPSLLSLTSKAKPNVVQFMRSRVNYKSKSVNELNRR